MNKEFKMVVSYTTRPKRESETDGVEHFFISDEEADSLLTTQRIAAYTQIGETGYRYFTTEECIKNANIYIIDPKGIKYLKSKFPELKLCIIYIYAAKYLRDERAKFRSDYNKYAKRCEDEDKQFKEFESKSEYDYVINNNLNFSKAVDFCKYYMNLEKDNVDMFCIVGRTCSGKDSIITKVLEELNS